MAATKRGLFLVFTAFQCVFSVAISASFAAENTWYSRAFANVLRVVNIDSAAQAAQEPQKAVPAPYISRVIKGDNSITVKGQVPSEGDVKVLQGVVAATSPGATFIDRTHVSIDVPDRDRWLAGMTFALRQLTKLETGSVTLRDNDIGIDGVIKADENFGALQRKITEEVPHGLTLTQIGVKPPQVRPFVWAAQFQSGNLSLTGHVPNELDQPLTNYAKSLFQTAAIHNGMVSAVGAPGEWMNAAKLSLDILTLFQHGSVTVQDKTMRVDGVFSSPGMSDLFKLYVQKLPRGFTLQTNVIEASILTHPRTEEINLIARNSQPTLSP